MMQGELVKQTGVQTLRLGILALPSITIHPTHLVGAEVVGLERHRLPAPHTKAIAGRRHLG